MKQYEDRIKEILDILVSVAQGKYESKARITENNDLLDALSAGLNMMIDDIKNNRDELYGQKEWFSITLQSIGEALIVVDSDNRISIMNSIAETLSGYKRMDAIGRQLEEIICIKDNSSIFTGYKVLQIGEIEIPIEHNQYTIKNSQGNFSGSIIILRDLSEKIQRDKEKDKLQAQLVHSSKLASVGMLAAGVAHEINNPLAVIKGNVGLIKKTCLSCTAETKIKKTLPLLEKIEKSSDRILSIIKSLSSYVRIDQDKEDIININTVIQEVLYLCETIFNKYNIEIVKKLDSNQPFIRADIGRIQQVITNILNNSRDAIIEKKNIGLIEITTYNRDGKIYIEIADNGTGLDKANVARLFEPFYTTKEVGKGTGLGLSISESIIQMYGGEIRLESEQGIGTTCIMFFPSCEPQSTTERTEKETGSLHQLSGLALIVDDEEDILDLLDEYLKSFGLETDTASNSLVAMEKIKKQHYDYIITDMKMPKLSGDKLILEIEKMGLKDTKIIVISGAILSDISEEQRKIFRRGAHAFFKKPFEEKKLHELLIKVSSGKKDLRALNDI